MTEKSPPDTLGAFWYAVGTLFCVPLVVIILLIMALIFLCTWPIIPILAYCQRKEELKDND